MASLGLSGVLNTGKQGGGADAWFTGDPRASEAAGPSAQRLRSEDSPPSPTSKQKGDLTFLGSRWFILTSFVHNFDSGFWLLSFF